MSIKEELEPRLEEERHQPHSPPMEMAICGYDIRQIVGSQGIQGLVELRGVPSNALLMKGLLEVNGKTIPLMDLRVGLGTGASARWGAAAVLIVKMAWREVGLILERSAVA